MFLSKMTPTSVFATLLICFATVGASSSMDGDPPTTHLRLLVTVDGKSYFVDQTTMRTWTEANTYCRSLGMKLASITSTEQAAALQASFNNEYFYGDFWTGGRDALTWRQFTWEGTTEEVASFVAFDSQIPEQTCVNLYSNQTNVYFRTFPCVAGRGVLCETEN